LPASRDAALIKRSFGGFRQHIQIYHVTHYSTLEYNLVHPLVLLKQVSLRPDSERRSQFSTMRGTAHQADFINSFDREIAAEFTIL
jgi:hypothetical protein